MAWIESHQALGRHPKLLRLAGTLRVHRAQALGHLHFLWWWALDYAPTGDVSALTSAEISAAAEWPGDVDKFTSALKESGWLDADGRIHDWMVYAGRLIEARKEDAERKRRARSVSSGHPPDIHTPSRVPNPTVPNPTNPTNPPTPFQGVGQWFEEVWNLYPNKDGKKAALRHFKASVKTTEDFERIKKALGNYLASENVKRGFVKNGSTWFNNWQDWVDYTAPAKASSPKPGEPGYEVTDVDKVISGFRRVKQIPSTDKAWVATMWEKQKPEAKRLLDYFEGDWKRAVDCIAHTAEKCAGLDWGWNAVHSRAAEFKNQGRQS